MGRLGRPWDSWRGFERARNELVAATNSFQRFAKGRIIRFNALQGVGFEPGTFGFRVEGLDGAGEALEALGFLERF